MEGGKEGSVAGEDQGGEKVAWLVRKGGGLKGEEANIDGEESGAAWLVMGGRREKWLVRGSGEEQRG